MGKLFDVQQMENAGVCQNAIDKFRSKFGLSVIVTPKKARKVAGLFGYSAFEVYGRYFLTDRGRKKLYKLCDKITRRYVRKVDKLPMKFPANFYDNTLDKLRRKRQRSIAAAWARCYNKYGPNS